MADKQELSKIKLPSGSLYYIKDEEARNMIAALEGYTVFLGVTTTALTDGAQTNPIVINGNNVTATTGGIATYNSKEFIFNGTAWQEFGDLSGLGSLAYKNSATGSFTPQGNVSQPTFSGNELTSTGSFKPSGSVTISKGTGTANYTPEGTVSKPTFTGSSSTYTGSFTPGGSVGVTVSPTVAGATPDFQVVEYVDVLNSDSDSNTYTPKGSVSAPTISVNTAGSTTTIQNPASKTVVTDVSVSNPAAGTATGELVYCAVENETLSLSKFIETTGASITTSNVTVKTGDASYRATAPSFTGTAVQFSSEAPESAYTGYSVSASFTGTQGSVSVSGTPAGSVSQPTFTGTGAELKGSFTGTSATVTVKGTPSGSVTKPTFTGTQGSVTVS